MTSNTNNTGIAHLAFRAGGPALCKNQNAIMTFAIDDSEGLLVCKRCQTKLNKMKAKKEARS